MKCPICFDTLVMAVELPRYSQGVSVHTESGFLPDFTETILVTLSCTCTAPMTEFEIDMADIMLPFDAADAYRVATGHPAMWGFDG